jgi:hypothetical protein
MIDFTQFDTLQLILFIFDLILVTIFSFCIIKAVACIYEDLYKERVKKFFKRFVIFSSLFFF